MIFKNKFKTFREAKKIVHKLNLKTQKEWQKYAKSDKRPITIPGSPEASYKNVGWGGYGDWLGTGRISNQNRMFLSHNQAKKIVQKVIWNGDSLGSGTDFNNWFKSGNCPKNIPSAPDRTYKKQDTWISWGDFLGTGNIKFGDIQYLAFEDARKFVRALELQGAKEWEKYAQSDKLPNDIPAAPWYIYEKEWDGSGDWLGNGHISNTEKSKNYISWPQAKIEYKKLSEKYGLRNQKDWRNFSKTHAKQIEKLNIPANPRVVYTKEKIWGKMK